MSRVPSPAHGAQRPPSQSSSRVGRRSPTMENTESRASGELGMEQMKSEFKAMQFQLQTAEQSQKTLHLLLRPVNQMRNELTAERERHAGAYDEIKVLQANQNRLVAAVTELEASETDARRAATLWRTRTFELECECSKLAVRGDTTYCELEKAQCRERIQAVRTVEHGIAHNETENAEVLAQSDAQSQRIEVCMLERELASRGEHNETLQRNLREARTENGTVQSSLRRLLHEHQGLRTDHDAQYASLCKAVGRSAALLSRKESLEDELAVFSSRARVHSAAAAPATAAIAIVERALPEVLDTLLGDASICIGPQQQPEVRAAAPTVQVSSARRQHPLDGLTSPLGGKLSPLRSPASRREYPGRRGRRTGTQPSACADDADF